MTILPEDIVKLLVAVLIGGLIGAEREFHDKAAGFRTMIFICVGATLFTVFSQKIGGPDDATRIAANIVSGVGFLGAGVIMRDAGQVVGLTTASTIWLTAALGMGIGGGHYIFAGVASAVMLVVLWAFPWIEGRIDSMRDERTYQAACATPEGFARLEAALARCGLRVRSRKQSKADGCVTWAWRASGPPERHALFVQALMADADVRDFRF